VLQRVAFTMEETQYLNSGGLFKKKHKINSGASIIGFKYNELKIMIFGFSY